MNLLAQANYRRYRWTASIDVHGRHATSVSVVHDRVGWHDDNLGAGKGVSDPGFVVVVGDLVRDDHDPPLGTLCGHEDGTLGNID